MKVSINIVVLLLLTKFCFAQSSLDWVVEPNLEYNSITIPSNKFTYPIEYKRSWVYPYFFCIKKSQVNKSVGLINFDNKIVIPAIYDNIYLTASQFYSAIIENKYHLYNKKGKRIINEEYEQVAYARFQFIRVKQNNKWGIIDTFGQKIVVCDYEGFLYGYREGFIQAKKNGKWGFVDTLGNIKIPFIYDKAFFFNEGFAKVKQNGKWFFIDKKGKKKLRLKSDTGQYFQFGLVASKKNGKWGFINKKGKFIIPPKYEGRIGFGEEGYASLVKNSKVGFINRKGKELTGFIYDQTDAQYPFARVWKDGKIGVLNWKREEIVAPVFEDIDEYQTKYFIPKHGVISAKLKGYWGCIDTLGNVIIDFEHSNCLVNIDSSIHVLISEDEEPTADKIKKWKYYDLKGKEIKSSDYYAPEHRLKCIEKNGKWLVVDKISEEVILPLEFDWPVIFYNGVAPAKVDGKWGILRHPYADKMKD